jgi:SHS2 domain-containing protein
MTKKAHHELVEHTGELELHITAPDLGSLLEEAARALADVMADDAGGAPTAPPEHLELSAPDREALLVDWLNELVYRADARKRVYREVHVQRADDKHVTATLRGREPLAPRTAVKAATWHRRVKELPCRDSSASTTSSTRRARSSARG